MKDLVLSPAAELDLDHIWDHTAEHWGPDQADHYTGEIMETCYTLASGVRLGRPVDVRAGYLKFPSGAHMIYFRNHSDRLEIIRILHQRQDVSRNLSG